ncbi:hypothetical protein L3Q82_011682 [Scortum barcoo]|uniref:Uncharacterized protein n=1 Tax=Scortum barcoo TaxID=214431 RepID=A0ACB8W5V3_9TELE|nr:hypothetical protein L3Q82_011682 [Scortum barcoo]
MSMRINAWQKLKRDGPVMRTIQQWSDQSDSAMHDCFSTMEWCVFKDTDIITYTDARSYIDPRLCGWEGSTTSSTLTLNTSALQGCVLSPLPVLPVHTHDCVATHSSNTIVKFADDTTVIGLITTADDDEDGLQRGQVRALTSWCQDNNLHLNSQQN